MEPGAILLLLGVLVLVGLFVAQPFTGRWHFKVQKSREISTLLTERERTLNALLELDQDKDIGKIATEEYSAQRTILIQKGSEIMRQLDEIQPAKATLKEITNPTAVEQRVDLLSDEDLEELIAKRRMARKQRTAGFCPNCGKPILLSDQYCPSCGQLLLVTESKS